MDRGDDGEEGEPAREVPASLVEGYRQGLTIKALAEREGLAYSAVRESLLRSGVRLRAAGRVIPEVPEGLVESYEKGFTIREVAAAFGLRFSTTRRMLLREGVQLRPPGTNR